MSYGLGAAEPAPPRQNGRMTDMAWRWAQLQHAHPDFAARVQQRFEAYKHHVLGTLRSDGSPRLTGLEADIRDGELWLGMMPNSRKAFDLRRDPRFSLHANPGTGSEAEMAYGDVRVSGRALEVTDAETMDRYVAGAPGGEVPEAFHLFRAELTEVVRTYLDLEGTPEMVFEFWCPGRSLRTIRRTNDESPPREDH